MIFRALFFLWKYIVQNKFFYILEGRVVLVERKSVMKPDQAELVLSEGNLSINYKHF